MKKTILLSVILLSMEAWGFGISINPANPFNPVQINPRGSGVEINPQPPSKPEDLAPIPVKPDDVPDIVEEAKKRATAIANDLQQKIDDASAFAQAEIQRQAREAAAAVKAAKAVATKPLDLQNLIESGKQFAETRLQADKERIEQGFQMLVKNSLVGKIKKHQALIVISELQTWADPSQKQVYSYIEQTGVPLAKSNLSQWYGQIVTLEHSSATEQNLLNAISALSAQKDIKAIDVFVFLHGSPGQLSFVEGQVTTAELGQHIHAINTQGKLRIMYNAACFGQSHIQDWLNAGFKVASGARAVNTNGATEYPMFLKVMALGQPFGLAITLGNDPRVNAATDEIARQVVKGQPVDSNKSIGGDASEGYLKSASQWLLDGTISPLP